jgi:hypothetical protein
MIQHELESPHKKDRSNTGHCAGCKKNSQPEAPAVHRNVKSVSKNIFSFHP